uniref:Uncharacterized protein n=1 Tax=Vespula pensylvanica TaxID=30213 RepID=A0A834U7U4_VESPE|nr:hypothetical protein H0235_010573 [Vespula pensylvanica]
MSKDRSETQFGDFCRENRFFEVENRTISKVLDLRVNSLKALLIAIHSVGDAIRSSRERQGPLCAYVGWSERLNGVMIQETRSKVIFRRVSETWASLSLEFGPLSDEMVGSSDVKFLSLERGKDQLGGSLKMCPWKESLGLNEREHSYAAVASAKDQFDSWQAVFSQTWYKSVVQTTFRLEQGKSVIRAESVRKDVGICQAVVQGGT